MRRYYNNLLIIDVTLINVKGLTTEERNDKVRKAKKRLKTYFGSYHNDKSEQEFRIRSCCKKTIYVKERMLDEGHYAELEVNGEMVPVFQDYVPVDCAEFIYVYSYIY